MRKILFILTLTLSACGGYEEPDPDQLAAQGDANNIFKALGSLMNQNFKNKSTENCQTLTTDKTCKLGSACDVSEFTLQVSGSACAANFYFKNESHKVSDGSRGNFMWTVDSNSASGMPANIKNIDLNGEQTYLVTKINFEERVRGTLRIEGTITTEEIEGELQSYNFIIDGKDELNPLNGGGSIGRSDMNMTLVWETSKNSETKRHQVRLSEKIGVNTKQKSKSINYFINNKMLKAAEFDVYGKSGATFFFKTTAGRYPWLGYTGPVTDHLFFR